MVPDHVPTSHSVGTVFSKKEVTALGGVLKYNSQKSVPFPSVLPIPWSPLGLISCPRYLQKTIRDLHAQRGQDCSGAHVFSRGTLLEGRPLKGTHLPGSYSLTAFIVAGISPLCSSLSQPTRITAVEPSATSTWQRLLFLQDHAPLSCIPPTCRPHLP